MAEELVRARCVLDCWLADDPLGHKLYVQGRDYMMLRTHPCAIHFRELKEVAPGQWEPLGDYLEKPPERRTIKAIQNDPEAMMAMLIETQKQLMELLAVAKDTKKTPGDEALDKILAPEKRGPGRPRQDG